MDFLASIARSKSDPKIIHSGPSSLSSADRLARAMGWFSIGLGVAEIIAAGRITRALGMEGKENLVRGYGVREIGSGILSLSADKQAGMWSRIAGDALDLATLMPGLRLDNPKRSNVVTTLALVAAVALLDIAGAEGTRRRHRRSRGRNRTYRDRSGFPRGLKAARGKARNFKVPADMRATPMSAHQATMVPGE
jgi:hypothetical protein